MSPIGLLDAWMFEVRDISGVLMAMLFWYVECDPGLDMTEYEKMIALLSDPGVDPACRGNEA